MPALAPTVKRLPIQAFRGNNGRILWRKKCLLCFLRIINGKEWNFQFCIACQKKTRTKKPPRIDSSGELQHLSFLPRGVRKLFSKPRWLLKFNRGRLTPVFSAEINTRKEKGFGPIFSPEINFSSPLFFYITVARPAANRLLALSKSPAWFCVCSQLDHSSYSESKRAQEVKNRAIEGERKFCVVADYDTKPGGLTRNWARGTFLFFFSVPVGLEGK